MDRKLLIRFPNGHDFLSDFNSDPEAFCPAHQLIYKIRIKSLQRTLAPVQNRDLNARPCGDMSKLKGDVPSPNKNDASRQRFQLQKLLARRDVLLSRNTQLPRHRPGCDNHMATF